MPAADHPPAVLRSRNDPVYVRGYQENTELWLKAAHHGNVEALVRLGLAPPVDKYTPENSEEVNGVTKLKVDLAKGRAALLEMATHGDCRSYYVLGLCRRDGLLGFDVDFAAAVAAWRAAADARHLVCMLLAAKALEHGGDGVDADRRAAYHYYSCAAELGDDEAKAGLQRIGAAGDAKPSDPPGGDDNDDSEAAAAAAPDAMAVDEATPTAAEAAVGGACLAACGDVLKYLMRTKQAKWFLKPVDPEGMGIDEYPTIVAAPMDFGTVKAKLAAGDYTVHTFVADVRLVFRNAMTFNVEGDVVHEAALWLHDKFEKRYADALAGVFDDDEISQQIDGLRPLLGVDVDASESSVLTGAASYIRNMQQKHADLESERRLTICEMIALRPHFELGIEALEQVAEPMAVAALDGRLLRTNACFATSSGFPAVELSTMSISDLAAPVHRHYVSSFMALMHRGPDLPSHLWVYAATREAKPSPFALNVTLVVRDGRPQCFATILVPVDEVWRAANAKAGREAEAVDSADGDAADGDTADAAAAEAMAVDQNEADERRAKSTAKAAPRRAKRAAKAERERKLIGARVVCVSEGVVGKVARDCGKGYFEIDDDTLGQVYVRGSESLTIVSFEPGDDAAQAKAKADAEESTVQGAARRAKLAGKLGARAAVRAKAEHKRKLVGARVVCVSEGLVGEVARDCGNGYFEIDDDTLGQVVVHGSGNLTIVSFEPGDDAAQAKAKADAEENTVQGAARRAKLAAELEKLLKRADRAAAAAVAKDARHANRERRREEARRYALEQAVLSEEARRRTLKQAVLRELLGFEHKVEAGMLAGKPLKVIDVVYDERDDRFWCLSRSQSGEEELTPLWAMPAEAKAKADAAAKAAATSDRRREPPRDADGDRTGHSYYPSANYERVLGTHITGQSNYARDSRLVITSPDSVITGPGSASVQLWDEACGFRVENMALDAKKATEEVIALLNKGAYHENAFGPSREAFHAKDLTFPCLYADMYPYVGTNWSVPKKLDVAFDLEHAEFGNQGRTEVTGACRDDLLHNAAGFTSDYVPFPDSATISKRWFEDRRVCVAPMVPGESGHTDHRDARVCNEFQPPKKKIPPLTMVFVLYLRKLADGSFEEAPDVDIKDVSGVRFRTVPRTGETRDTSEDFEIRVPHGGFWAICARANAYYTHGVFCAANSKLPPGVYRVPVVFSNYGRASDD